MSRSVIMPTSRSPSVTGIEPASMLSMKFAASCTRWSGLTVCTSRLITSLTFMVALPLLETRPVNEQWRSRLRLLGGILGQEVIGRDHLVALVEDLDRPADHAGILAFERLRSDGELNPHRIAWIEWGQEAQVLETRVGEDRARVGVDE